jgi:hypothetical protein
VRFAQVGKLAGWRAARDRWVCQTFPPRQSAPEKVGHGEQVEAVDLVASVFGDLRMDSLNNAVLGARRNEDIALDLMKFVAGTTGVGKPTVPSTGFTGQGTAKPEEHVNQLLALYSRCLKAVEGGKASS